MAVTRAPRRWDAGMNVVGFQAFDLDDFDRDDVSTAQTLRTTMGIDRAVFVPTLYHDPSTGAVGVDAASNATLSDAGIRAAAAASRRAGLRVALKPHVNFLDERASRTTMDPSGDRRDVFWRDYRRHLLHYAALAAEIRADWLVVGTELSEMTSTTADVRRWRALIASIRRRCDAKLTFAANYDAIDRVRFWDALDGVCCDFFFTGATFEHVYRELKTRADRLGAPYFFTEIGCREPGERQAARFRHAFEHAITRRDARFRGFWWYDWYAFADRPDRRAFDDFTPRLRAREVLLNRQGR